MSDPQAGTMSRASPEHAAANILRDSYDQGNDSSGKDDQDGIGDSSGGPVDAKPANTSGDEDIGEHGGSTDTDDVPGSARESGEAESAGSEGELAERESKGDGEGNSLSAIAEKLGIKVKDLYKVEIPMGGDGETMTLGALKDLAAEAGDLTTARAEIEESKTANGNEIMAARAEMSQMITMMGGAVTPELLQRARSEMNLMAERERRATLEAMPEWKDKDTFAREREAIHTHLRGYGFSQSELSNVHDHRLLKMIADATRDRGKIRGALDNAKAIRTAPGKPGTTAGKEVAARQAKADKINRAKTGNTQSKTEAVHALLSGVL